MSAKCRDSSVHCAVIAFASARKHEICGRKKYPLYLEINYMFLQYYQIFPPRNPLAGCVSVPLENLVAPGSPPVT